MADDAHVVSTQYFGTCMKFVVYDAYAYRLSFP